MSSPDLLAIWRGSITAPAGCGKTQLIADTLKRSTETRPALVLTHTNAGKSALEQRMKMAEVSHQAYRVWTIDSWCIRLARRFPARAKIDQSILNVSNARKDYPALRAAVASLIESGDLDDPLKATYSRVLIDEYQDCNLDQHRVAKAVAAVLPTVVLGDPLQSIFDFDRPVVHWQNHVHAEFPHIGDLDMPWRWKNAKAEELGLWLLSIRPALLAGQPIDLRSAPPHVSWMPLPADYPGQHSVRMKAARTKAPNKDGTVLIIGDSMKPDSQRGVAHATPGAICVEAVDFKDLTLFASSFNPTAPNALETLIAYAGELMTNLSPKALVSRVAILAKGTSRSEPTSNELAALSFHLQPGLLQAATALQKLSEGPEVRVYRPGVLRMLISAMTAAHPQTLTLHEAIVRERDRQRHLSAKLPKRAVGSTLLLKGLEADLAIVLHPEKMNGRHLYVALTRGARALVVCSTSPVLFPSKAS